MIAEGRERQNEISSRRSEVVKSAVDNPHYKNSVGIIPIFAGCSYKRDLAM